MHISPDGQTQTDHVLINQRKCRMEQDVKTLRGPKRESYHYLVKNVVKQKLITIQNNYAQEGNWNKANLQDKNKLKQYRQYLHNILENKREEQDINNEWKHINKSILQAANAVIQPQEEKNTMNVGRAAIN
jgi:hypothetical protein